MLRILIVEDDAQLASMLRYLVEDNPRYHVVAVAEDLDGAVAAAAEHDPDLALVDLHLARGSSGYSVAVRLNDAAIPCLFVTGRPPGFALPDLALGCLLKPFTGDQVHRALAMAEDMMRGRKTLRPKLVANLQMYEIVSEEPRAIFTGPDPSPPRPSFKRRLERWITGPSH